MRPLFLMRPRNEPGALRLGKPQPAVAIVEQHLAFGVPRSLPHVAGTREPCQGDCTQRSGSLDSSRSTPFLWLAFNLRRTVAATEVGAQPFLNPDPPATLSRGDCGPGGSGATLLTICRSRFLVVLIIQS